MAMQGLEAAHGWQDAAVSASVSCVAHTTREDGLVSEWGQEGLLALPSSPLPPLGSTTLFCCPG